MSNEQIQILEGISCTLLGMDCDHRIPADARAVLVAKSQAIDVALTQLSAPTTAQETAILKDSEFERCNFGPDDTCCDHCDLPDLQLYYRRTSHEYDEGEYVCLCCIAVKKAKDEAEGAYVDLEAAHEHLGVEKERLEDLLREIEVPGVVVDGTVRINYDLKKRIAEAVPKEST